ncbi:ATP-dependent metallopeptidase FtsH/Yme1/Tma family protein [Candidatus Parcubacteria bacterium]|jgi:cell division protease FtsH|nr:MAG: ATP-dependent metallopeptidase FtsH/Yme1/Tma family protein [Candidatus Parcubacteria bacterium]
MKSLGKNILFTVIFLIITALLFGAVLDTQSKTPEEISISAVAKKIIDGEVKTITVQESDLILGLQDGIEIKSKKESGVSLLETLSSYGITSSTLGNIDVNIKDQGGTKYWMGIIIPTLIPLLIMGLILWWMFRQAKGGANQAFSFGRVNIRLFSPLKDKILFKDVAGLKEAKEELWEVVEFLKNPKKFHAMGAKIPRGVLLMGSPGTGKTMLARAVAGESGVPFFHISASEFVEMFVGVGASRVRDLFQVAKKAAPAIIFIDEIDAVGRERGTGMGGGHDEREQTLNQILVEMDGFERDTSVIVVAATNRPDVLDQALLRPGRFDRRVMLDMPDIRDREEILKIHAKGKPLSKSTDLHMVALRTPGFAGAELANLMNEAAILAARNNRKFVEQEDLLDSIEKVLLGPARKNRIINDHEKQVTAYHEAGHAIVAAVVKNSDPVHKVSVVSRGMAGGYTLKLPMEEKRLRTKSDFLGEIAVSLGGYAAEQAVFKDITTGSSSDIQQATDVAESLVTKYGMSEKLGPRAYGNGQEVTFFGRGLGSEKDYSETIGTTIDVEINEYIQRGLQTAKKIMATHRKALDGVAAALIEKETLEQEEFYKLIENLGIKKDSIILK